MTTAAEVLLHAAVRRASLTPARIVGLDGVTGSIAAGKRADRVLFDEGIRVKRWFSERDRVWRGEIKAAKGWKGKLPPDSLTRY